MSTRRILLAPTVVVDYGILLAGLLHVVDILDILARCILGNFGNISHGGDVAGGRRNKIASEVSYIYYS